MDEYTLKEEKKKKAHRKRDKFWKFVFQDYQPKHKSISSKDNITEQNEKINSLSTYAQNNFSVCLEKETLEKILESNSWDSKRALVDLVDYEEASHGILVEPPVDPKLKLLGCENDIGTSCYIDSLLFAMYISNTAFDPLLTYDISSEEEEKAKLQTVMRLFVNKLRKGHFINAEYVHWFRELLREGGWNGQDDYDNWTQEDASELFMFITEMFDLPYLPFQIRLFHGANRDSDDDRVMTDRTLTLSIPADDKTNDVGKNGPLQLQDILVDYFYNSIITGVRRQVDNDDNNANNTISENVAASPSMAKFFEDEGTSEKDEKDTLKKLLQQQQTTKNEEDDDGIAVTAWQVLELLPFYSAMNEQGESINTQLDSSFPDTHMILPIVLKRYRYDNMGGSTKIKRRVEIPVTIDFNRFVNQNSDDPMCPTCGHLIDWTLHFKSAVCHRGDSPFSGHYISYARVDKEGQEDANTFWLKLDDMNKDSRVTLIKDNNLSSIQTDLAENAYIIFYELDKTCHHGRNSVNISSDEDVVVTRTEYKSGGSTSTYETGSEEIDCNCNAESSKKPKQHKHKHKHHHHHYHLKESCSLM